MPSKSAKFPFIEVLFYRMLPQPDEGAHRGSSRTRGLGGRRRAQRRRGCQPQGAKQATRMPRRDCRLKIELERAPALAAHGP
jgi:hypothetical protein